MSEPITTAEELDALPVGSVVLDRHGDSWQQVSPGAWMTAGRYPTFPADAGGLLPATLLTPVTAGATVTEWGVRCDRGIMERICIHGIGHYDWDQWEYHKSIGAELEVVHVCDFCCREHERAVVT